MFDYWIVSSYGTYGPFSGNSSNSALPSSCGNPTGIPCGGTGATTPAGALANLGGLPLSGGTITGNLNVTGTVAAGTTNVGIRNSTTPSATKPNGIYASSYFGVKCDGSTDDSTALNSIGTFASGLTSGYVIDVEFPANSVCVHASEITTWTVSNLHIQGNGARLKFTGAGSSTNGQIYLHGSAGEVDNLWIQGFILQGNPSSTWGVYQDNGTVARSKLEFVNVQDQATGCYYLRNYELSVGSTFVCSSNQATVTGTPQVTQPQYGLIAGSISPVGFFANNRMVNVTLEGVGVIGLWCVHCTNGNYFFGTAEGVSSSSGTVGVGLQDYTTVNDAESNGNVFAIDVEADAVADANISGFSETLLGMNGGSLVNINGGNGVIVGGNYQTIAMNSSLTQGWSLINPTYNQAQTTGAITGLNPLTDLEMGAKNRLTEANSYQFPIAAITAANTTPSAGGLQTTPSMQFFNPSFAVGSGAQMFIGPLSPAYSASISSKIISGYGSDLWLQSHTIGSTLNYGIYLDDAGNVYLGNANTIVSPGGNLGIGVSPVHNFDIGGGGSLGFLNQAQGLSRSFGFLSEDLGYGQIEFYASSTDNSTLNTPLMTFQATGNIGIGSTAPGSRLTVKGGDAFVDGTGTGVILRDTVTTTHCYRITIASGAVTPTLVTCPTD